MTRIMTRTSRVQMQHGDGYLKQLHMLLCLVIDEADRMVPPPPARAHACACARAHVCARSQMRA